MLFSHVSVSVASLPSKFREYLENIRPTDANREDYTDAHTGLRGNLTDDDNIKEIYVSDFLQGSYRRSTAVKPHEDGKSDVDIVLVTNLDREDFDPRTAMETCEPFVNEHYTNWEYKDRSFGIDQGSVELDLVLTAAPSEATKHVIESDGPWGDLSVEEELNQERTQEAIQDMEYTSSQSGNWEVEPLYIPDRRLDSWEKTHPLATIGWTTEKNDRTDGHYVNIVKAIKWWRRTQVASPERPKSYPLEHMVGDCCPDDIESVAKGVTRSLEIMARRYQEYANRNQTPTLEARGLPEIDVLDRIDGHVFAQFHQEVVDAASLARKAFNESDVTESNRLWRRLFGEEFPSSSGNGSGGGDGGDGGRDQFRKEGGRTEVSEERFAL